ncbi:MAG: cysteine desulfuration protein SufE [Bacteroidia bacterium]|jgi:cysteine desulfuration protein SufE
MIEMKTIENSEQELVEEFAEFEDLFDKFGYLIDLGQNLKTLDEALKTDNCMIKGCQAHVWLYSELKDGKIIFLADANADYAKGLVAMMIRVLSEHTPDEIINAPLNFIERIGFKSMLSMKRAGGLESMIKQMKLDAMVYKAKSLNTVLLH